VGDLTKLPLICLKLFYLLPLDRFFDKRTYCCGSEPDTEGGFLLGDKISCNFCCDREDKFEDEEAEEGVWLLFLSIL
jgi:hypothetical protein